MSLEPEIIAQEPRWTEDEALALRTFIQTTPGQQFLRRLTWMRPRVTEKRKPYTRQIQQDERAGHEQCYLDILHLAEPSAASRQGEQTAINLTHEQMGRQ